ncbi:Phospholipase YtpA [Novipirellula aureliae]|uniref:Phospholipase YtpA n=1 Tax=Novipirellula aureliae TaxID=2527966 RepID=A0A5C6E7F8_9BACT|nr:bifunctional alpha/beta hydrolase/class I SAM-dependent methyltransferase [Novipirellula aureliae]TWU43887.1 Phospholipase YtpA [Novipirellula aureliae]
MTLTKDDAMTETDQAQPALPIPSRPSSRESIESSFVTSDGQTIFFRAWHPKTQSKNAVILFHRGHEHSGRWQDFVDTSKMEDCWFFAWDCRGHGRTAGERGAAESFSRIVRDADEFAKYLCRLYELDLANIAVVGQSVGAVLAAAWIHDYAPPIRAMVLATPAFRIKLYVPLAIPALRVLKKVRPKSFIQSYVRPSMLTHDERQADAYANDPLISPQIAVNILLDLHDTSTRLVDDAAAISTPTLMFVSGRDYVVRQDVQHRFFDRLSSTEKHIETLPKFYHSTFWEKDRAPIIQRTAAFLNERFESTNPKLGSNELSQGSKAKYASLQQPASLVRRVLFAAQRIGLTTAGRLSRGVKIGWESGFDSGQSLDHVYRNRAEGTTPLGRWVDRNYLNSIGWRGIRGRKVHMEELLDKAIAQVAEREGEITILDIAAGPGRYVIETIGRNKSLPIRAILCDRDRGGLEEGKALAKSLGLSDRIEFKQSDAFDPEAIKRAAGDSVVNIAIVSGLYELFPENAPIEQSLAGIASVLADEGFLLYTDQPWHPQQEMIARVLPNRDGDPWVMRCRSQFEMDALVREAGLERQELRIDKWGIFSVALATRTQVGNECVR